MKRNLNSVIGVLPALVLGAFAFGSTGCGALSAMADPRLAWAIKDPAPMSVVVRRADAAEDTSKEVTRLLTATPVAKDANWPDATMPAADQSKAAFKTLSDNDMYKTSHARVVAAEVWAPLLASLAAPPGSDAAKKMGNNDASAKPATTTLTKAALPTAAAAKRVAKNTKTAAKKGATQNAKAAAAKVEPKVEVAAVDPSPTPKAVGTTDYPSVLAAIDPDLADKYSNVMSKRADIAKLGEQIGQEKTARDAAGVSPAEKQEHKDAIVALKKQLDEANKAVSPAEKAMIAAAKDSAAKASPEVRDRLGIVLVDLRQAVEDAGIANGAAAIRYPFALSSIPDSVKAVAKQYAADVIEEKTGTRPNVATLQAGVTMKGSNVDLTINGFTASDAAKMDDIVKETTARTEHWVVHTLALMATISSTKESLTAESDLLDALLAGFAQAGWKAPNAPKLDNGSDAVTASASASGALGGLMGSKK
jgi:hypothetical protein